MFRTSICPSSGVQVVYCCMWCSALGVVAVVLRSRCVVLCTVCEFVSDCVGYKLKLKCNRFLKLGRPVGAVTLSRWEWWWNERWIWGARGGAL